MFLRLAQCGVVVVVLAALGWLAPTALAHDLAAKPGTVAAAGEFGGPFHLIDHHGRPVTDADFRGKLMLIYFGYTHCPDICPLDAQSIAAAMDQLGDKARGVQPLFITIDPARDTAERLAEWLAAIHPRFLGLTGTSDQIAAVTKAYKVEYERMPETVPGSYEFTFSHAGLIYLMGTAGHFLALLPSGTEPDEITAEVAKHLPKEPPAASSLLPSASTGSADDGSGLEVFRLADQSNLRRLDNGDFLFRLARDQHTGVVYWAYNGNTRNILAVAPSERLARDDDAARQTLLAVAKLPRRTGCGLGSFHLSTVWIVPEDFRLPPGGRRPDITPILVEGDVQTDNVGRAPPRLVNYRNHAD
jgi:cytochrome oxidase Cu insertion factor (SCO1/SenC/PrrC family)